MSGKPGRSGGRREGAGRPPKTRTLRTGTQLLYHYHAADGSIGEMPQMATVEVVSRTLIRLRLESGESISLGY
jgi:hypothetical protein